MTRARSRLFSALLSLVVLVPVSGDADLLARGSTTRASVPQHGGEADGHSQSSVLSADGTVVAFTSQATNLVPGDTNGVADIYVRDLVSGTLERASLRPSGEQSPAGTFWAPDISGDGRWVAYSRLVGPDTPDGGVFLYDRFSRSTTRVSVSENGSAFVAYQPVVSFDGAAVAMVGTGGLWLWTRSTGFARRLADPSSGASFSVEDLDISADGNHIAFSERFPWGIAVLDVARGTIDRIVDDGFMFSTSISHDGRYVGYLLVREGVFFADVVIFDRTTRTRSELREAVEAMGPAKMASDGRHVLLGSIGATVPAPLPGAWVWDRVTGETRFVSFDGAGLPSGTNLVESVSHDAAVFSVAVPGALEPQDTNGVFDVYVRNRRTGCDIACVVPS